MCYGLTQKKIEDERNTVAQWIKLHRQVIKPGMETETKWK